MAQDPLEGQGFFIIEFSRPYTEHTLELVGPSGRVISQTQRPPPDNTHHLQMTDIYAPGGILTHKPSKQATANPRLRQSGDWDRHSTQKCKCDFGLYIVTMLMQFSYCIIA